MITLAEIAREAGVSRTAVSYVLNNRPNRLTPETRERILRIARRHDYHPNALVRAIKSKKTHVIGALMTDLCVTFFGEILSAVENAAEERGYQVLVGQTHLRQDRIEKQIQTLREHRVDGVIVCPMITKAYYADLKKSGLPLVFVNSWIPDLDIPRVHSDDVLGAKLAVRHLIGLGHQRIAAFPWTAPFCPPWGDHRLEGYKAALREAGLPFDPALLEEPGKGQNEETRAAVRKLLARTSFTALFANTDISAIAAIEQLRESGKRVPEDVAVVGYGNLAEGAHLTPSLTSVDQKTNEIGFRAATALIDRIEHPERPSKHEHLTVPELVVRESCGANRQVKARG